MEISKRKRYRLLHLQFVNVIIAIGKHKRKGVKTMDLILVVIYILVLLIFSLAALAVLQIKLAGIKVKDFWTFVEANQILDKLYKFSKYYDSMSSQEQVIFLQQAEEVFDAFEKVPDVIWEDEHSKYILVLDTYKNIKLARWNQEGEEKIVPMIKR